MICLIVCLHYVRPDKYISIHKKINIGYLFRGLSTDVHSHSSGLGI